MLEAQELRYFGESVGDEHLVAREVARNGVCGRGRPNRALTAFGLAMISGEQSVFSAAGGWTVESVKGLTPSAVKCGPGGAAATRLEY